MFGRRPPFIAGFLDEVFYPSFFFTDGIVPFVVLRVRLRWQLIAFLPKVVFGER